MYFEDIELYDVAKIKKIDLMLAHIKNNKKETLSEHMDLVYKHYIQLVEQNQLDIVFKSFEETFFKDADCDCLILWKEMICNTVYMHDVGKANPDFQFIKMRNIENFKQSKMPDSTHSALSGVIYLDQYYSKIFEYNKNNSNKSNWAKQLMLFAIINSYIISKHHGTLDMFEIKNLLEKIEKYDEEDFLSEIYYDFNFDKDKIKEIYEYCKKYLINMEENLKVTVYIYAKFLFSLLVASDFYSVYQFNNGVPISDFGRLRNTEEFWGAYINKDKYKDFIRYKTFLGGNGPNPYVSNPINELRTKMFIESEETLKKNLNKNLFYLEAPTGSGKTNMSINLSLNILKNTNDISKIFYIFPFNNLVEQTKNTLIEEIGEEKWKEKIGVINSVSPIIAEGMEEEKEDGVLKFKNKAINYEKALLNRQFLHYPIVLTTHVNFFDIIFGTTREECMALSHLANSVVIIDEIQSYKNAIWKEIILFLQNYARILNLKVIIMSATLPKLGTLNHTGLDEIVSLIAEPNKYFENKLFKNRVNINYELLEETGDIKDRLKRKILEKSKLQSRNLLVEFISKREANEFFKELKENQQCQTTDHENLKGKTILLLTGDDNKANRKEVIERVKREKNIILIATQVIEAGIDIDMDIGFKDISFLDSEEQFLGRINRSCLKSMCESYFFSLTNTSDIYKNDIRNNSDLTLLNIEMRKILESKLYAEYYSEVLERLNKKKFAENNDNYQNFVTECIGVLSFKEIKQRMRLIDDDKLRYTVFLDTEVGIEGELIRGKDVWESYKNLLTDKKLGYAEKKVSLSWILEKMDYFTYDTYKDDMGGAYSEYVGGIFYFEDGKKYFTEGKFDSEKLKKL
jgi:CRISPR-associated endonuclease/helicase Cas3